MSTDLRRLWTWPLATLLVGMGALWAALGALPGPTEDNMRRRAEEVAAGLRGTTKALEDFATDYERDDQTFLRELDALVFVCDECGWWCGEDERSQSHDFNCDECSPEEAE